MLPTKFLANFLVEVRIFFEPRLNVGLVGAPFVVQLSKPEVENLLQVKRTDCGSHIELHL